MKKLSLLIEFVIQKINFLNFILEKNQNLLNFFIIILLQVLKNLFHHQYSFQKRTEQTFFNKNKEEEMEEIKKMNFDINLKKDLENEKQIEEEMLSKMLNMMLENNQQNNQQNIQNNIEKNIQENIEENIENNIQDLYWEFIDLKGKIQGPFPQKQMLKWTQKGILKPSLLSRHSNESHFFPLCCFFPDFSKAFISDPKKTNTGNNQQQKNPFPFPQSILPLIFQIRPLEKEINQKEIHNEPIVPILQQENLKPSFFPTPRFPNIQPPFLPQNNRK
ncbi:zinc finger ccch domain-containing protein [Anaeramoeba ignava]|uniref:Zinc finger ccch domain-containing protein n=1 Tax=Anaeramoeba ignava TaxID=1746090 RepID=A0A9Q0LIF7_ANAIG|nr:zinc finger ccch domain-containing protein [Anaeramoeba ignava]